MSNLVLRLLTALVLLPLLLLSIEWKNPLGVWGWVLFAQFTGLREWMNMTLPKDPPDVRWFGVVLGVLCAAGIFWLPSERHLALVCSAVVLSFLYFLFRIGDIGTVATRISFFVTGLLYAGVLITPLALFKLRSQGDGAAWIYICLTVSWFSDTGAYFAGRFLGPVFPRKLFESVSPKKTVIGAIGGLLASILALVIAKLWYLPRLSSFDVVAIAVPANVLGQLGDLCESLIKRSVGVKDSGVLLPGHGGMLDRIDALLFVVPYAYAYAVLMLP